MKEHAMLELLHTGVEHPDLWWILVPSVLSFLAGLGLGTFSDSVRDMFRSRGSVPEDS